MQYRAGKYIALTDYLSRHLIVPTEVTELENNADGQNKREAEVVNQSYSLFEFIQMRESIKRFIEQTSVSENSDQSQSDKHVLEQNQKNHSLKTSALPNGINSTELIQINSNKNSPPNNLSPICKMDKVNGINMQFIYKKRGHSPEKQRLWIERNHMLMPDKSRIVGKRKDMGKIQECRPSQTGCKRIVELNIEIYNRFKSKFTARQLVLNLQYGQSQWYQHAIHIQKAGPLARNATPVDREKSYAEAR